MTELKKCPFCNCSDIATTEGDTYRWMYVECAECGAKMEVGKMDRYKSHNDPANMPEAIAAWNRRAESETSKAGELPPLPPEHVIGAKIYTADQMREYALAAIASAAQPSAQTGAQERGALADLVECTSMLIEWCVKNVDKWSFPQYDWTSRSLEKARAALAAPAQLSDDGGQP